MVCGEENCLVALGPGLIGQEFCLVTRMLHAVWQGSNFELNRVQTNCCNPEEQKELWVQKSLIVFLQMSFSTELSKISWGAGGREWQAKRAKRVVLP